jgi:transcriptional regulator of arginine metabolism
VTAVSPATKAARQAQIAGILERAQVRSQEELAGLLADRGFRVAQATLSRDLEELGAVRLRGPGGALVYALPGEPGGPGSRPGGLAGATPPPEAVPLPAGEQAHARAGHAHARAGHSRARADQAHAQAGHARAGQAHVRADQALPRVAAELLVSAEASANLVVLRTPAGGAQLLASALDHAQWPAILGTVAGDDTVLVITRDPAGGAGVAGALLRQAERRAAGERWALPHRGASDSDNTRKQT